jgi:hypothetical protein
MKRGRDTLAPCGSYACNHSQMFCLHFHATAIYNRKVSRAKIILYSLACVNNKWSMTTIKWSMTTIKWSMTAIKYSINIFGCRINFVGFMDNMQCFFTHTINSDYSVQFCVWLNVYLLRLFALIWNFKRFKLFRRTCEKRVTGKQPLGTMLVAYRIWMTKCVTSPPLY